MNKTKFDLLFETIAENFDISSESPYKNEEYVKNYVNGDFKVVIVKVTDEAGEYFEYMLGKIDENGEVIDWPYFESSDEFETIEQAIDAADDYILDYEDDVYNRDDEVYGDSDEIED